MNATFKQTAALSQRLRLSRTMKQSLELLQYSTEELHTFLKERMEEIPFMMVNIYDGSSQRLSGINAIEQMQSTVSGRQLLHKYVREQLLNEYIEPEVWNAIHWLVDDLDEDGLLTAKYEEYAMLIGTSVNVIEKAICHIQSCEPAGIGASSLADSLLIQAKQKRLSDIAIDILTHYFEAFRFRKWRDIEREGGYSSTELQAAIDEISTLQLLPLHILLGKGAQYVRPDATITFGDRNEIRFFKHAFPDVGIDYEYIQALPRDEHTVKEFVMERLESIQLIKTQLIERKSTIKLVIEQIVEKQFAYFREGASAIVPLTMTELAKQLGLHESTISRAIREKYIHTPFGTVPLRQFFTQSASSSEEIEVSPNRVKEKIKFLIHREDKRKPLSDQKIVELLKMDGIPLSRRVISKYREQLKIPASSYRKRLN